MPVKDAYQAQRTEEITMLQDMLGVTETSYRELPK
jgi:hypothetical protein